MLNVSGYAPIARSEVSAANLNRVACASRAECAHAGVPKLPLVWLIAFSVISVGMRSRAQPDENVRLRSCRVQCAIGMPVKSHSIATPFRGQCRPPAGGKSDHSDGAKTGVAEPHIAEQSRSWRAASGEREVMRGS